MPVRGTTAWRHAILQRKVINLDHAGDRYVMCAWDTCEKDGYESNKVVTHEGASGYEDKTITYVFCSENHKDYWLASIRPGNNNNHSPGMRGSLR
jgi:hypothetical protein